MCVSAIQKNLNVICFTDHVDHNPRDDGYEYYSAQAYFQEIERVRQKYGDRLNILSGMEFSEPHLYPSQFEEMKKLPYDFIIGSLHYWVDDLFPSEMVKKHIPLEECYAKYWAAMHRMVEYGGFDCVGHIDFPKRYYHSLQYEEENMRDLFRMIVRQRIVIEINTSSLRRGLTETMAIAVNSEGEVCAVTADRKIGGAQGEQRANLIAGRDDGTDRDRTDRTGRRADRIGHPAGRIAAQTAGRPLFQNRVPNLFFAEGNGGFISRSLSVARACDGNQIIPFSTPDVLRGLGLPGGNRVIGGQYRFSVIDQLLQPNCAAKLLQTCEIRFKGIAPALLHIFF